MCLVFQLVAEAVAAARLAVKEEPMSEEGEEGGFPPEEEPVPA